MHFAALLAVWNALAGRDVRQRLKCHVDAESWTRMSEDGKVSLRAKVHMSTSNTHLHIDIIYGVVPELFLRQPGEEVLSGYQLFQVKAKHVGKHVPLRLALIVIVPSVVVTITSISASWS